MALINCPECVKQISDQAASCPNCGMPRQKTVNASLSTTPKKQEVIRCPKCYSTNLHVDKKGFSGGKAFVGAITVGNLGLLAGTIGSNDILITCLKCGHKFNPVKDAKRKRDQEAQERMSKENPAGMAIAAICGATAFLLLFISGVSIWWSVFVFLAGIIVPLFTGKK